MAVIWFGRFFLFGFFGFYPSAGLVVVQIHQTLGLGRLLARVHKLAAELLAERDVLATTESMEPQSGRFLLFFFW